MNAYKVLGSISLFVFFITVATVIPELSFSFVNFEDLALQEQMGFVLASCIAALAFLFKPLYTEVFG